MPINLAELLLAILNRYLRRVAWRSIGTGPMGVVGAVRVEGRGPHPKRRHLLHCQDQGRNHPARPCQQVCWVSAWWPSPVVYQFYPAS